MDKPMDGAVRRGEILTLVQRSVRRRDHGLRRGDQDLGRLRFTPGRRSLAQADTDQTGALVLTAGRDGSRSAVWMQGQGRHRRGRPPTPDRR